MRKFLILSSLIVILISSAVVSMQVALAAFRPFRPGDILFPLQDFAEQTRGHLIFNKTDQAIYYLDVAVKRTVDLAVLAEGEHVGKALDHLNRAVDRAIIAIAAAPRDDLTYLSVRLSALILRVGVTLNAIGDLPPREKLLLEGLQAKVATLQSILVGIQEGNEFSGVDAGAPTENGESASENLLASLFGIPPHQVAFPPGSPGAVHAFYPLVGAHAALDCAACHGSGQYAGTPTICSSCHSQDTPPNHFIGECSACHTPFFLAGYFIRSCFGRGNRLSVLSPG